MLVQQLHGRGLCRSCCLHVCSSCRLYAAPGWFGRLSQRLGATANCCIICGIVVASPNCGRSSAATCAATRPSVSNAKGAQALGHQPCATAIRGRATPAASLDPASVGLLAKVSELKHRLTARRSLGGLLAERAAVRSGEKCLQEEKRSRRKKRKRDDGDSSSVTSVTEEARVFFFRRWQPHSDHG